MLKKYLSNKNIHKASTEELSSAYLRALQEEELADDIAEFMINRWLLKNTEVYNYFADELKKINPDFTQLEEIDHPTSVQIIERSNTLFGSPKTYLFAILNSVVLSPKSLEELAEKAKQEKQTHEEKLESKTKMQSIEEIQQNYEQQLAKITDKYEKKLQGLQKKYHQDVDSLKKQISALQKKLSQA